MKIDLHLQQSSIDTEDNNFNNAALLHHQHHQTTFTLIVFIENRSGKCTYCMLKLKTDGKICFLGHNC